MLDYPKSHTGKDLARLEILDDEFKIRFVNGKSDETLVRTLLMFCLPEQEMLLVWPFGKYKSDCMDGNM
jgi:hypothetical protein